MPPEPQSTLTDSTDPSISVIMPITFPMYVPYISLTFLPTNSSFNSLMDFHLKVGIMLTV